MLNVPFENLDIHLGRPILLDEKVFFDKIVDHRRGGFCYELNGLFAALLRQLGFEVTILSAGVAGPDGAFGPDFDHMALLVSLETDWLADVGFGDSFLEPIMLDEAVVTEDTTGAYRITTDDERKLMLRRAEGEVDWKPQYRFTLEPRVLSDYREMCRYQQTSPESHFTQQRICSLATSTGRITLTDQKLITTSEGIREERMLSGENEFNDILAEQFGIII
jgi:N-hydroxyarylamine O-acetyltransferase